MICSGRQLILAYTVFKTPSPAARKVGIEGIRGVRWCFVYCCVCVCVWTQDKLFASPASISCGNSRRFFGIASNVLGILHGRKPPPTSYVQWRKCIRVSRKNVRACKHHRLMSLQHFSATLWNEFTKLYVYLVAWCRYAVSILKHPICHKPFFRRGTRYKCPFDGSESLGISVG